MVVRTAGSGPLPSSTPETQPIGYDLLLVTPGLGWADNPQTLVLVQQLAALAGALACYALLARCGVSTWLAAAATLPVLLAPAALAGERLPVPDAVFAAVTATALLVLCWRSRWPVPAAILGGGLLGVSVTLRGVHEPLLLLAVVVFALAAGAWSGRALWAGAAVLGFAIPVVPLLTWAHNETGRYAVASSADAGHQALDASPSGWLIAGLALAAVVGLLAAAGARRAAASPARLTCLVLVLVPAVVLVDGLGAGAPSAVDLLPALALWPAAAALGLTALLRGRRGQAASRPQVDDVDRASLAAFRERYGDPVLAPVVIVIAAYDEAAGIGHVLAALPSTACGLDVDVLVVDDASTDGTAAAAALDPRVRVVACPVNRGQGAALRLGYRVARDHGARYIVTTDADGQYDPEEIPDLLAPVVAGTADFVTGSRRLGRHHSRDHLRRSGVYAFAWAVNALTGLRVTDTSFGMRAMRAEVTAAVTLNQPQYQSSELLIGVHSHGFRVAEVPGTMHPRGSGSTKKGHNIVYGWRYARVVIGTWWREGCPRPVAGPAADRARFRFSPIPARWQRPSPTDRTAG